jgi:hypothetical protein
MKMYVYYGSQYCQITSGKSFTDVFLEYKDKYDWFVLFTVQESIAVKPADNFYQFKQLLDDYKIIEYIEYGVYKCNKA